MYNPRAHRFSKGIAIAKLARRRAAEGHLPAARQLFEALFLWMKNDLTPPEYFATGLYRREIPWRQKDEHLGSKSYRRWIERVNDKRYDYVGFNKLVAQGLLRTFAVPTPEVYGFVGRHGGQTSIGEPIRDANDFRRMMVALPVRKVCFKIIEGWGGKGFLRAAITDDGGLVFEPSGESMSAEEFWSRFVMSNGFGGGYIVQGIVDQHPAVAHFNPSSVNTCRVWVTQPRRGHWEVFAALFRTGTGASAVDNLSAGGITAPVDLETGTLGVARNESPERPTYPVHPTTGVQIEGSVLPMWREALDACRSAAAALPYLRLIGFDVAFSRNGPVVLELEVWPADDQIGFDRGVKSLFRELSEAQ